MPYFRRQYPRDVRSTRESHQTFVAFKQSLNIMAFFEEEIGNFEDKANNNPYQVYPPNIEQSSYLTWGMSKRSFMMTMFSFSIDDRNSFPNLRFGLPTTTLSYTWAALIMDVPRSKKFHFSTQLPQLGHFKEYHFCTDHILIVHWSSFWIKLADKKSSPLFTYLFYFYFYFSPFFITEFCSHNFFMMNPNLEVWVIYSKIKHGKKTQTVYINKVLKLGMSQMAMAIMNDFLTE